jgi:hypothetical protein
LVGCLQVVEHAQRCDDGGVSPVGLLALGSGGFVVCGRYACVLRRPWCWALGVADECGLRGARLSWAGEGFQGLLERKLGFFRITPKICSEAGKNRVRGQFFQVGESLDQGLRVVCPAL